MKYIIISIIFCLPTLSEAGYGNRRPRYCRHDIFARQSIYCRGPSKLPTNSESVFAPSNLPRGSNAYRSLCVANMFREYRPTDEQMLQSQEIWKYNDGEIFKTHAEFVEDVLKISNLPENGQQQARSTIAKECNFKNMDILEGHSQSFGVEESLECVVYAVWDIEKDEDVFMNAFALKSESIQRIYSGTLSAQTALGNTVLKLETSEMERFEFAISRCNQ